MGALLTICGIKGKSVNLLFYVYYYRIVPP